MQKSNEKRIGILGGTFNPIHMGHLAIAQMSLEKLKLNKILFVPSYLPPHKRITYLASAYDRLQMVRLGIKGNPHFEVLDYEIKRKGRSYTIETVKFLKNIYLRKTKLYFIIGEDSLPYLKSWKQIEEVVKIVSFIVVNRPGYRKRKVPLGIKYHSVVMPGIEISSSYLRQRISQGKSIKYLVPDEVISYIENHQLYTI